MPEGFKINSNLGNQLDILLRNGSLDKETEILEILETLSKKINALQPAQCVSTFVTKETDENRLHRKWGKSYF